MDTGKMKAVVIKEASRLSRRHVFEAIIAAGLAGGCTALGAMVLDSTASLFTSLGLKRLGTAFILGSFGGAATYLKGLYQSLPEAWNGEERRG